MRALSLHVHLIFHCDAIREHNCSRTTNCQLRAGEWASHFRRAAAYLSSLFRLDPFRSVPLRAVRFSAIRMDGLTQLATSGLGFTHSLRGINLFPGCIDRAHILGVTLVRAQSAGAMGRTIFSLPANWIKWKDAPTHLCRAACGRGLLHRWPAPNSIGARPKDHQIDPIRYDTIASGRVGLAKPPSGALIT